MGVLGLDAGVSEVLETGGIFCDGCGGKEKRTRSR